MEIDQWIDDLPMNNGNVHSHDVSLLEGIWNQQTTLEWFS